MERIREIKISETLPRVFVSEVIPDSEIWLSQFIFHIGEEYQIEAASGGGKSSLCAYLYGSRTDYEGEIYFNGRNIKSYGIDEWQELRRRHIAYLPQELSLFPELTALENIELKNKLTNHIPRKRIMEWMERIGISERVDYPCGKMSIGQQQRVAIVRALCQPFDFLILDEPVSHLDGENNRIAATLISEEAERQGAGIISTSVGNPLKLQSAKRMNL